MFYPAPEMTPERAQKEGLLEVSVNPFNIVYQNIDKTNKTLVDAWDIVHEHFAKINDCWATIGYIKGPSLWKRFIDFWWVK